MEIVFIRHGHGEHLVDYPNQLNILHPGLTEYGRMQVMDLKDRVVIGSDDLVVASPTKRTIETAQVLLDSSHFFISAAIGPRMFPQMYDTPSLLCDLSYTVEEIKRLYPTIPILECCVQGGEGINKLRQQDFEKLATDFINVCRERTKRLLIISHDGTISNYRVYFGEKELTRKDFLGEAGMYQTTI
ncbi:histidine phosphatase family protein [Paenibacillus sp. 1011MAR3C5]|uniref:histidine phosphatase family protein n=1 Tax=Paenibacillus sp. 1011MAR3C5 TaxID=1675787 RepID=UPI000E6B7842|nr:histidine phosphatase family protein [Paenibacillus sp. 1011MAR3C5]RJE90259.1 histidine phosphatase family protein [Paenibacillus sp. 1011MAR3C5]